MKNSYDDDRVALEGEPDAVAADTNATKTPLATKALESADCFWARSVFRITSLILRWIAGSFRARRSRAKLFVNSSFKIADQAA